MSDCLCIAWFLFCFPSAIKLSLPRHVTLLAFVLPVISPVLLGGKGERLREGGKGTEELSGYLAPLWGQLTVSV